MMVLVNFLLNWIICHTKLSSLPTVAYIILFFRLLWTTNKGVTFLQSKKKSWFIQNCLIILFVLDPLICKIGREWSSIISEVISIWIIYGFRSWYVLKYFLILQIMKLISIFEFCMRWLTLNYVIVFQYTFKNYCKTT